MATYIPYKFHTQWTGGTDDRLGLLMYGSPDRYRVTWGDGAFQRFARNLDQTGDGVPDVAIASHSYARDGVYTITVRPDPADDLPARRLRAHVHAHDDQGYRAVGNDYDEMFLMGDHADTVRTGGGSNWVSAGAGDDVVIGGSGADTIDGGAGKDRLDGGAGSDRLYGGDGNDVIHGGAGSDIVFGGDGDDRLHLDGTGGYLFGDAGRDVLIGGDGGDTLDSGAGVDRLTGGAGGDIFTFGPDASGRDVITDWGNEGVYAPDRIDLSALATGLDFIGTGRFTGTGGEVRFVQHADTTIVLADLDGDRITDFSIALVGAVVLTANDFLL